MTISLCQSARPFLFIHVSCNVFTVKRLATITNPILYTAILWSIQTAHYLVVFLVLDSKPFDSQSQQYPHAVLCAIDGTVALPLGLVLEFHVFLVVVKIWCLKSFSCVLISLLRLVLLAPKLINLKLVLCLKNGEGLFENLIKKKQLIQMMGLAHQSLQLPLLHPYKWWLFWILCCSRNLQWVCSQKGAIQYSCDNTFPEGKVCNHSNNQEYVYQTLMWKFENNHHMLPNASPVSEVSGTCDCEYLSHYCSLSMLSNIQVLELCVFWHSGTHLYFWQCKDFLVWLMMHHGWGWKVGFSLAIFLTNSVQLCSTNSSL